MFFNAKLVLMDTKLGFLINKYRFLGFLNKYKHSAVVGKYSRGRLSHWFYCTYETIPTTFFALSSVIGISFHVRNSKKSLSLLISLSVHPLLFLSSYLASH